MTEFISSAEAGPLPASLTPTLAPSNFAPSFAAPDVRWRFEALLIFAVLLVLLIWDASGLDLWISSKISAMNGPLIQGFSMRHAWLTESLMHRGGKFFYGIVVVMLVFNYFRPLTPTLRLERNAQRWWFLTMLLCIAAISLLKYLSKSSCPWDLAMFGGTAQHISHWNFVLGDGGPGRCFPSGHVSGAFALMAISFAVRPVSANLAKKVLIAVLLIGGILGAGQVVRGAHFVSHVFYSAWICWLICFISARLYLLKGRRQAASGALR